MTLKVANSRLAGAARRECKLEGRSGRYGSATRRTFSSERAFGVPPIGGTPNARSSLSLYVATRHVRLWRACVGISVADEKAGRLRKLRHLSRCFALSPSARRQSLKTPRHRRRLWDLRC